MKYYIRLSHPGATIWTDSSKAFASVPEVLKAAEIVLKHITDLGIPYDIKIVCRSE